MALDPAPRSSYIRMIHPTLGAEEYELRVGFRSVWYDAGWRSPLDDPAFSSLTVIDGGGASAVGVVIDGGGATALPDLIDGGTA